LFCGPTCVVCIDYDSSKHIAISIYADCPYMGP
jgi:hypothetical protein